MKNLLLLLLAFTATTVLKAQTTYQWVGGASGSWTTGANWSPVRTTPATNDIMLINSGSTVTIVDIPNQTIGKLQISSNTSVYLRPQTTGNRTLTVNTAASDAITVAAGSSLTITGRDAATDRTLTLTTANTAGLQAVINGTLTVGLDNAQPNAYGSFSKGGANATITFNSNSTYQHAVNGGTIPSATWATSATCTISGTTNSVPGGLTQSFGNFTWNGVAQSANISFNGNLTTVNGNFRVSGTNSQELRLTGNTNLTMNVGGDFIIENSGWLVITNGDNAAITINISGNFSQDSGIFDFFTGTGGGNTLNSTFDVNITGNFTLSNTGIVDFAYGNNNSSGRYTRLNVSGNFSQSGTGGVITSTNDADISNGTITFNKNGTQTFSIVPANFFYINFIVANGSVLQMGSDVILSSTGNPVWGGKFTVNGGGTLEAGVYHVLSEASTGLNNAFDLKSGGTLNTSNTNGIQNGTLGTISNQLATISFSTGANYKFTGSGSQLTSGLPASINSIEINNSGGVTLTAATTVNSATSPLILTNGILTGATLTISSAYTGPGGGGSASSHINGPLAKIGSTDYEFPVGNGTLYRPVSVSGLSGSATMTVQYFQANPRTAIGTTLGSGINHIGVCEYWTVDDGPASVSGIVGLKFGNSCNGNGYVDDPSSLLVAHWTGTQWSNQGNDGTATSTGVKASIASTFSPFTIGSSNAYNPLPVKIGAIRAYEKLNGVQVDWTAFTEINVAKYVVERSADGSRFTSIGEVTALNNGAEIKYGFFDPSPNAGLNFYRIRNMDIDGKSAYSNIVRISLDKGNTDLNLYPNPVQTGGQFSLNTSALKKGTITLHIFNVNGQEVFTQKFNHGGGAINQSLQLPSSIKAGLYTLQLDNEGTKVFGKPFIIQ